VLGEEQVETGFQDGFIRGAGMGVRECGGALAVFSSARVTGSLVTTSRFGGAASGRSCAVTSMASRFDRWKKRGSTSSRFSGVRTFAS
jgi:hypothetical protein